MLREVKWGDGCGDGRESEEEGRRSGVVKGRYQ